MSQIAEWWSSLTAIRRDIASNEARSISEDTIYSYLKALRGIFAIEDAKAWSAELRAKDAVRTSDTRYFTDPSIAAVALGVTPRALMNDLIDAKKMMPPAFKMVLTATGEFAYRRPEDGIVVCPISALRP